MIKLLKKIIFKKNYTGRINAPATDDIITKRLGDISVLVSETQKHACELIKMLINIMFILNGGAAIALLAKSDYEQYKTTIAILSCGVMFSGVLNIVSFAAYYKLSMAVLSNITNTDYNLKENLDAYINKFKWYTLVLYISFAVSLALFIYALSSIKWH